MCDVGCESRSCLDTSLDNCSSERDNDSTVFSRLVLCVLSAFFSVSGTYRCSILKIKTMTKNFITQEKRRKIGRKSWHLSVWSSFHNWGLQRWPGVQRYELCQNPVSIQWLGVLIFALATDAPLLWCPDHGENVGAESVYISTCPELPPLQAPALSTADYCCRLQLLLPTVACFMRAESIIVSFHRSSTLNKLF